MYELLNRVNCPEDVKKLNPGETLQLANEIRSFLIESVSKTGGHLASNLGVVELTLALMQVFDFPKDKVIWDVGHQSYVYKLLTGRRDRFSTLRQFGGLSGFPKTGESVYDSFNTGHSSTSVSAALGLAKAYLLSGKDDSVIAVIGDGALSGGMALEALCDAGSFQKNLIVILNDNNMSISKSVSGFTLHLTRLRSVPAYLTFKSGLERALSRIPFGKKIVYGLKKIKDMTRHALIGNTMFDDLGFTYFGPIDGHDIDTLALMLERAKKINGPVLLHILTKKGKGYKFAEDDPTIYHGVSTFEAAKGVSPKSGDLTYSGFVGKTLCELGKTNDSLCVVTAAMAAGTGTEHFFEQFPNRFFDVGIAEQHAVTFAAGLATGGMRPFVVLYSSFLQRAYDQILHDVCLQNLNVVFCIDRAGIVGEDGETHHGLFDMSFLSAMPNMTVLAPANFSELSEMFYFAANRKEKGPIAIRYPRGVLQNEQSSVSPFEPGKPVILSEGKDICILCAGLAVSTGEKVEKLLRENGISATLVNLRTVCPLPRAEILSYGKKHQYIVTIEDGVKDGGIGEQIGALLSVHGGHCKVLIKGYPAIVTHGSTKELKKHYAMDAESITKEILDLLHSER